MLKDLNPERREAALYFDGPLLILAGAGSGKTRVLTYRVALLVASRGVDPARILAITFTNKAAEEMRGRIYRLVGPRAGSIWVSTFHSACSRILRREAERLGYRKGFVIYDDDDQLRMINRIIKDMEIDTKRYPPRLVRSLINDAKNEMIDADSYRDRIEDELTEVVSGVYKAYQAQLFRNNAMDFDDLLLNTVAVFELYGPVLEHYQERFSHINVDEYQDTNLAQYRLVKLLSAGHRNLCVVGDDDQGIYSWRGADLRNILEFEKDYPESRVVRLERNYRSTRVILEAANNVVSHIPGRKEKRLWTEREEGEPIRYFFANSGSDETAYVALEVSRLLEGGEYGQRDFAVFYRTNAQSRPFEEILLRFGIPYKIVGGFKFYERKEVKDALAYLKFLLNPDDTVSLRRIINEPKRGIGETTLAHLDAFARSQGVGMWEALQRTGEVPNLGSAACRKLAGFVEIINGLSAEVERLPLPELLQAVLDRSGYLEALEREGTFEAEGRAENLQELKNAVVEFSASNPGEGLDAFLERVSLVAEIDLYDEEEGAVTLMTLHNAKGLEFPVVFIVGMEDGIFPHMRCMGSAESMEEERRLFYVGVTRAKDRLYLSGAAYRSQYGSLKMSPESRFIRDIPRKYMEFVKQEGPATIEVSGERVGLGEPGVLAAAFQVGDSVVHDKFGEGVVTALSRSRSGPEITINFPAFGEKLLLLEYAPIRKK
ncbi:MAG: UvrD-helicase domain-containing protein [Actinomycetota bacterium]|nr:UvrD-helicase domain-containing protein [Actinomycetota bacterium]